MLVEIITNTNVCNTLNVESLALGQFLVPVFRWTTWSKTVVSLQAVQHSFNVKIRGGCSDIASADFALNLLADNVRILSIWPIMFLGNHVT